MLVSYGAPCCFPSNLTLHCHVHHPRRGATFGRRGLDFPKRGIIVLKRPEIAQQNARFLTKAADTVEVFAVKEPNLSFKEAVNFRSCDSRSRKQCDTPLSTRKSNPEEPMGTQRHLLVQRPADRQWRLLILDNGFSDRSLKLHHA